MRRRSALLGLALLLVACRGGAEAPRRPAAAARELPGSIAEWEQVASSRAKATTRRIDAGEAAAVDEVKGGLDAADPAVRLDAAAAIGLVRTHVGFTQLVRTVAPEPEGMPYIEFCTGNGREVLARVAAAEGRSQAKVLLDVLRAAPELEEHVWFFARSERKTMDELFGVAAAERGRPGPPAMQRFLARVDEELPSMRPEVWAAGIAQLDALAAKQDREALGRFVRDPAQLRLHRLYAGGKLVRLGGEEGLAIFEAPESIASGDAHVIRDELEALERETTGALQARVREVARAYATARHPAVKAGFAPPRP